jgi:2'-5' RNA ligase superfamily
VEPFRTNITLVLEEFDSESELAQAHRELYPERIGEHIPMSLTLLYPWIPAASLTEADVDGVRAFFGERQPFAFDLVRVAEFPGLVAYAVPEPDEELRALMRALWERYPEYPPYGQPGTDPPPHATLGRLNGDDAITREQAEQRVSGLLPVRCEIREAMLMEEYEPDMWRHRETLPLGR